MNLERYIKPLVLAAIALIAILAFAVPRCSSQKAQSRVDRGQAEAGSDTGEIAINTLEATTANSAATDRTVDDATAAVRAAPEAQKGAVTVNQACRFKANRNKPQCQGAK